MFAHKHTGRYLAVVGLIVFGLYAFLLLPGAGNAVTTTTVGQFQVSLVPVGTEPTAEYLELGFNSPAAGSSLSLEDWSISIDGTEVTSLSGVSLSTGQSLRFCSFDTDLLPGCTPLWNGEVFPDGGGTLAILDAAGVPVAQFTYDATTPSSIVYNTYDWQAELYAKRDQVTLCSTRDGVAFKLNREQATKVVDGLKNRTVISQHDIVPAFYYRFDTGLGYYPGQNWSAATAAKLAANCQ